MKKIKILFLAANPTNTSTLGLDEEIRAITQKIRASAYHKNLELVSAWAVRPDDLLQVLNEHKPHIVHFSGHGNPSGDLILVDDNLIAKAVTPSSLRALFQVLKDNVQVIILNACYSKVQAEAIGEIIDCVIGMNSTIGDQAAITFAASFYRAIGFGRSVRDAYDQGKVALRLEGIPEETTPQLLCKAGVDASEMRLIHKSVIARNKQFSRSPKYKDLVLYPYEEFRNSFREIIAPKTYSASNAVLHLVFGNLSNIRHANVVIPINQDFDFWQRGPQSVLASFENIEVAGKKFFGAIEQLWAIHKRPSSAGIGNTKFIKLPQNSQSLKGVIFVVTTRNVSQSKSHLGRYMNTPVEGIDYAIDKTIEAAEGNKLTSIAIPLLGGGYANTARTILDPFLELYLQQLILALTIRKLDSHLTKKNSLLKRAIVVVYSLEPQGTFEHKMWEFALRFVGMKDLQRERHIEHLLKKFMARTQSGPILNIQKLKNRDPKEFAKLCEYLHQVVKSELFRFHFSSENIDDLTQDIIVNILNFLDKMTAAKFKDIVLHTRLVANKMATNWKMRESHHLDSFDEIHFPTLDGDLTEIETNLTLKDAIQRLHGITSQISYLLFIEGKSRDEVAQELGISYQRVETQANRARKKLREILSE